VEMLHGRNAWWFAIDSQADRPLRRAAEDLAAMWAAAGWPAPRLEATIPPVAPTPEQHLVLLGATAVQEAARHLPIAPAFPPAHREGFTLSTQVPIGGWRSVTQVVGQTETGTVAGVRYLLRQLNVSADAPFPAALSGVRVPFFDLRGMYAHTAWLYHYPYALRTWSVADWQRYADLLAALNLNLLTIWIPVGMLPLPISDDDARWLARFREVVDYAHQEHGMTVWVGECANNLLEERPAEPIEEREYFTYCASRTVNPGDPRVRARLIENRSLLYRAVGNADGYWIIDGDPGGWDGSPADEFVTLFQENVAAIARCSDPSPTPRPLYCWLLRGWGLESQEENVRHILRALQASLPPDRWGVLAHPPVSWPLVRELHLEERTVYFPYGALEGEPSTPLTRITPTTVLSPARAAAGAPRVRGVLGNTQTPLMQLPHHFLWASAAWNPWDVPPIDVALAELGRCLFPTHATLLAEAWGLLAAEPALPVSAKLAAAAAPGLADELLAGECADAAARLKHAMRTLGPPGPVGRALVPDPEHHVQDLVTMLELRELAARLSAALDQQRKVEAISDLTLRCARRHVAWLLRSGYVRSKATNQPMRGSGIGKVTGGSYHPGKGAYGPYVDGVLRAWNDYQRALPGEAALVRGQLRVAAAAAPAAERARLTGWIEEVVEGKGIR